MDSADVTTEIHVPSYEDAKAMDSPRPRYPWYRGRCSCGWFGGWMASPVEALAVAKEHSLGTDDEND